MVSYITPGVYFKTSHTDQRAIDFLRTDIAAFIGIAQRGALHMPTRVNSWAQFQALFGDFIAGGYLAYCVKAFFENGGRTCFVVRIAHDDPIDATVSAKSATVELLDSLGVPTLRVEASSPGVWGERIAVRLTHNFAAATHTRAVVQPVDRLSLLVDSVVGFQMGGLVRLYQEQLPAAPLIRYTTITRVDAGHASLTWDAPLDIAIDLTKPISLETHDFVLSVYFNGQISEVYTGLSLTGSLDCPDLPTIKCHAAAVVNSRSTLVRLTDLNSASFFPDRLPVEGVAPLTGGRDGLAALTIEDFTGDMSLEKQWGLRMLENIDEVAILSMPDLHIQPVPPIEYDPLPVIPTDCCIEPCPPVLPVSIPTPPEQPPKFSLDDVFAAQLALIQHCETHRDRIALIDPPFRAGNSATDLGEIQSWRARFDSSYAALYYPWLKVYDPLRLDGELVRAVPPAGHIAGIYARSDTQYGVYKAPANEIVRWAQNVAVYVDDGFHGILNPLGINALRMLPGRGLRIYGARTMSSASEWRFVNVRRLLMMIEEAIEHAVQWSVFEPNDFRTRQMLILVISSFLRSLWQQGALIGAEESQAFFVRCDEENNPADLTNLGQLVVDVGVAPVKPAEFVLFSIGRTDNVYEITEQRGMSWQRV